jgi:hypothetical protein
MLSSCNKDPLDACAEDPTCEYFRCKVNGEWWTPDCEDGPLFGCRHTDVQYYKLDGTLIIIASSKINNESFNLTVENIKSPGTYKFYNGPNVKTRFGRNENSPGCNIYNIYQDSTSNISISLLDTTKFIIEGKFSFSAKNDCNDIIEITDGSFRQLYRF